MHPTKMFAIKYKYSTADDSQSQSLLSAEYKVGPNLKGDFPKLRIVGDELQAEKKRQLNPFYQFLVCMTFS